MTNEPKFKVGDEVWMVHNIGREHCMNCGSLIFDIRVHEVRKHTVRGVQANPPSHDVEVEYYYNVAANPNERYVSPEHHLFATEAEAQVEADKENVKEKEEQAKKKPRLLDRAIAIIQKMKECLGTDCEACNVAGDCPPDKECTEFLEDVEALKTKGN